MKRHKNTALSLLLVLFLPGATAQAQEVIQSPQDPRVQLQEAQEALKVLSLLQAQVQGGGLRGGGGRGSVPTPPSPIIANQGGLRFTLGAWWTNTALVARLGLTDDQKARIERAFENHRQKIVSSTEVLEKEEAQLARLLEAEPIDRNAIFAQIDRVTQARGEMERANSAMTLEMRESLTRAQWMLLQPSAQRVRVGANVINANLISQVEPVYAESARQAGIQGAVMLEAEISREGIVESLKVVAGPAQLTQAAIDAVKQWRYKPTMLNGEPVPVVTTINVNFPFSAGSAGGRGAPSPAVPGQIQTPFGPIANPRLAPAPSPSGPGQRGGRGQQ